LKPSQNMSANHHRGGNRIVTCRICHEEFQAWYLPSHIEKHHPGAAIQVEELTLDKELNNSEQSDYSRMFTEAKPQSNRHSSKPGKPHSPVHSGSEALSEKLIAELTPDKGLNDSERFNYRYTLTEEKTQSTQQSTKSGKPHRPVLSGSGAIPEKFLDGSPLEISIDETGLVVSQQFWLENQQIGDSSGHAAQSRNIGFGKPVFEQISEVHEVSTEGSKIKCPYCKAKATNLTKHMRKIHPGLATPPDFQAFSPKKNALRGLDIYSKATQ